MSLRVDKKSRYVPSLIIYGGDEDWNVLRPKKLIELLVTGCIREWMKNENISLNQVYNDHATKSIIDKYEWLYCIYYSRGQLNALNVGDQIDFRLDDGKYVLVRITHRKGTKLSLISMKLDYDTKWDIDYSLIIEPKRFAKPKSISENTNFASRRFCPPRKGSNIFINPSGQNKGWKLGIIINLDEYTDGDRQRTISNQRLIQYEADGKRHQWWAHLDDHEQVQQYVNQPKVWEIAFDSKSERKRYGPFTADQMRFIYQYNRYDFFQNGLFECKGKMKIKRQDDDDWTNLDETDIYLLLSKKQKGKHCYLSSIERNKMKHRLQIITRQKSMLWMYRLGSYGTDISGLYSTEQMITKRWKNKSGIFVKRVGEKGWYESNDSDLRMLFYHLSFHKDIQIPLGIKNVPERIQKAHTQCLEPHIKYNESKFILDLMKAMDVGAYYVELEKLGFKNADSMIKDLEPFILSDDGKANDSQIMKHFSKSINDKEKWIKVGYIIYHSCKLMPAFKSWTDLLNEDYLEKNFSYARCVDHINTCCCIVQRLMPLNLFIHIYNKDICYIPGQINKQSPYFIPSGVFIETLPHYNLARFNRDWKHFDPCMGPGLTMVKWQNDDSDNYASEDDSDDDDDDDDYEDCDAYEHVEAIFSKIFSFFDKYGCNIKCHVEDCHSMNRKCFPPLRTHKPYPMPADFDREKMMNEYTIISALDTLHNIMQHITARFGENVQKLRMQCKLMEEEEFEILQTFIVRRKAANEKYKGVSKKPEVGWHFDDNKVGWNGIATDTVKTEIVEIKEDGDTDGVVITPCKSIEEFDACIARYYKLCNRNDYYNDDKEGKLIVWVEDNGFEMDDIIQEIDTDAADCMLVDIDLDDDGNNLFPLHVSVTDEMMRMEEIYKIIKNCFENSNAYKNGLGFVKRKVVIRDELYIALGKLHK